VIDSDSEIAVLVVDIFYHHSSVYPIKRAFWIS